MKKIKISKNKVNINQFKFTVVLKAKPKVKIVYE